MYKRILDIVDNYSKKKRILDDKAIEKIFRIIRSRDNTEDLVKKISVFHRDEKTCASYFIATKEIKYDKGLIIDNAYGDDFYAKNMHIVVCLLHEMEHVNQLKKVSKSYKPRYSEKLECEILKYSYNYLRYYGKRYSELSREERSYLDKLGIVKREKFILDLIARQKSNYRIDPCERMAQIKALNDAKMMLSISNKTELYDVVGKTYDNELLRGYTPRNGFYCVSPTYEFLKEMGFEEKIYEIKSHEKDDITLNSIDKRLTLGIYVPHTEILNIKNKSGK